jgi:REP element-mobilizing transposase RayT
MARKLRVEYPGAIHHVMSRGDRREPIFKSDVDRQRFLETLGECCLKTSWEVHAYVLMANHFHRVVETPQANLVVGMKRFLGTYTSLKRCGPLSGSQIAFLWEVVPTPITCCGRQGRAMARATPEDNNKN